MRNYWGEISGQVKRKPDNSIRWEVRLGYAEFEIISGQYDDAGLSFGQNFIVDISGEYELDLREEGVKEAYSIVEEISIPSVSIEVTTYKDEGRDERNDLIIPSQIIRVDESDDSRYGDWFKGDINIKNVNLVLNLSNLGSPRWEARDYDAIEWERRE